MVTQLMVCCGIVPINGVLWDRTNSLTLNFIHPRYKKLRAKISKSILTEVNDLKIIHHSKFLFLKPSYSNKAITPSAAVQM